MATARWLVRLSRGVVARSSQDGALRRVVRPSLPSHPTIFPQPPPGLLHQQPLSSSSYHTLAALLSSRDDDEDPLLTRPPMPDLPPAPTPAKGEPAFPLSPALQDFDPHQQAIPLEAEDLGPEFASLMSEPAFLESLERDVEENGESGADLTDLEVPEQIPMDGHWSELSQDINDAYQKWEARVVTAEVFAADPRSLWQRHRPGESEEDEGVEDIDSFSKNRETRLAQMQEMKVQPREDGNLAPGGDRNNLWSMGVAEEDISYQRSLLAFDDTIVIPQVPAGVEDTVVTETLHAQGFPVVRHTVLREKRNGIQLHYHDWDAALAATQTLRNDPLRDPATGEAFEVREGVEGLTVGELHAQWQAGKQGENLGRYQESGSESDRHHQVMVTDSEGEHVLRTGTDDDLGGLSAMSELERMSSPPVTSTSEVDNDDAPYSSSSYSDVDEDEDEDDDDQPRGEEEFEPPIGPFVIELTCASKLKDSALESLADQFEQRGVASFTSIAFLPASKDIAVQLTSEQAVAAALDPSLDSVLPPRRPVELSNAFELSEEASILGHRWATGAVELDPLNDLIAEAASAWESDNNEDVQKNWTGDEDAEERITAESVIIRNLAPHVTTYHVNKLLSRRLGMTPVKGYVNSVQILRRNKVVGRIRFSKRSEALAAIRRLHRQHYGAGSHQIDVRLLRDEGGGRTVIAEHLPWNTGEEELFEIFSELGGVEEVTVQDTGNWAIVDVLASRDAARLVTVLDQMRVFGRTLQVFTDMRDRSTDHLRYYPDPTLGTGPARSIWVGNLPLAVRSRDLYKTFLRFGELAEARVSGSTYGWVRYDTDVAAVSAMTDLAAEEIGPDSDRAHLMLFKHDDQAMEALPGHMPRGPDTVFVGGLGMGVTERDFFELTAQWGQIVDGKRLLRTYGTVTFQDPHDAQRALRELRDHRALDVKAYREEFTLENWDTIEGRPTSLLLHNLPPALQRINHREASVVLAEWVDNVLGPELAESYGVLTSVLHKEAAAVYLEMASSDHAQAVIRTRNGLKVDDHKIRLRLARHSSQRHLSPHEKASDRRRREEAARQGRRVLVSNLPASLRTRQDVIDFFGGGEAIKNVHFLPRRAVGVIEMGTPFAAQHAMSIISQSRLQLQVEKRSEEDRQREMKLKQQARVKFQEDVEQVLAMDDLSGGPGLGLNDNDEKEDEDTGKNDSDEEEDQEKEPDSPADTENEDAVVSPTGEVHSPYDPGTVPLPWFPPDHDLGTSPRLQLATADPKAPRQIPPRWGGRDVLVEYLERVPPPIEDVPVSFGNFLDDVVDWSFWGYSSPSFDVLRTNVRKVRAIVDLEDCGLTQLERRVVRAIAGPRFRSTGKYAGKLVLQYAGDREKDRNQRTVMRQLKALLWHAKKVAREMEESGKVPREARVAPKPRSVMHDQQAWVRERDEFWFSEEGVQRAMNPLGPLGAPYSVHPRVVKEEEALFQWQVEEPEVRRRLVMEVTARPPAPPLNAAQLRNEIMDMVDHKYGKLQ